MFLEIHTPILFKNVTGLFFWNYCRLGWYPQKRTFEDNQSTFLRAWCPSCHPTNSVWSLERTFCW